MSINFKDPFYTSLKKNLALLLVLLILAAFLIPGFIGAQEDVPPDRPPPEPPPPEQVNLCPNVIPDKRVLAFGCSALELTLNPSLITGPLMTRLAEASERLKQSEIYPKPLKAARAAIGQVINVNQQLQRGNVCAAAVSSRNATRFLTQADTLMEETVAQRTEELLRTRPTPADDLQKEDMEIALMKLDQALLKQATRESRDGLGVVSQMCDEVLNDNFRTKGRVVELDNAARIFKLDNGMILGLSGRFHKAAVMEGLKVGVVDGLQFRDGTGLAKVISGVLAKKIEEFKCMDLRIAPIQRFWPLHPVGPPYVLHETQAYDAFGGPLLFLEEGMRLAVENRDCPKFNAEGDTLIYSMKIDFKQGGTTKTVAPGLSENFTPVPFTHFVVSQAPAKLITTEYVRACHKIGNLPLFQCDPPVTGFKGEHNIVVKPIGFYSRVFYCRTNFNVTDNGIAGDFDLGIICNVELDLSVPTNATFQAEGYKVEGGGLGGPPGVSSRPEVKKIVEGNGFAVYEDDFYDPQLLFTQDQIAVTGTIKPSGLRWPFVAGIRNGKPFRYFTSLPDIVRDMVSKPHPNECLLAPGFHMPQGPLIVLPPLHLQLNFPPIGAGGFDVMPVGDAFYRIPFDNGFQIPSTGLLNIDDSDPSRRHPEWQAYAVDLVAPEGTLLRAARGGEVTFVEESDPYNVKFAPAGWKGIGNYLFIRHEDGTYAVYFHLKLNGALVQVGQKVHRGHGIALVGDTGNSSAPHVHFGVHSEQVHDVTGKSVRIRYEALLQGGALLDRCYIPRSGDTIESTNIAP